jgi:hypothetical protein
VPRRLDRAPIHSDEISSRADRNSCALSQVRQARRIFSVPRFLDLPLKLILTALKIEANHDKQSHCRHHDALQKARINLGEGRGTEVQRVRRVARCALIYLNRPSLLSRPMTSKNGQSQAI